MKKNITKLLNLATLVCMTTSVGCASVATVFEVISPGEVLPALSKITDAPDSETPCGGDDDGPLFYAYDAAKNGHYEIYKKDKPVSGAMTQMTSLGSSGFANKPTYSKAKDKIAFCMGYDIYTMPATKGKALTQITNSTNLRDNNPCFSPDGNLIVFDRNKSTLGTDGKYHFFHSDCEIWVKNLQTGEITMLGKGRYPAYSPDGRKIVYAKYDRDKSQIWIMDTDGENQSKLTDNNTIKYASLPRFSPDGNYIIFTGVEEKSENMDLYVIPVEGGDLTRLTISKASDLAAYWSTDGYIYFTSDRGGKKGDFNIWRFKYTNN